METANVGLLSVKLIDEKLKTEKEYWQRKMSGALEAAGLPLDFQRPPSHGRERHVIEFKLPPETAAALLKVSGGKDALVFTLLVAALKVCLHKYTGAEDIVVGTGIHERYGDVTHLNKVLALRDRVSGDMTVRQLLQSVKQTLSEAYAHQKYPFDRVTELLGVEPPPNRAPLFDVAVAFRGISGREHVSQLGQDVTLDFEVRDGEVRGAVDYDPALFRRETIEVFCRHFERVAHAVVTAPDGEIAAVELLTEEDRRAVLFDFNDTRADYPADAAAHRLFERQAAATPDATAVIYGGLTLSYRELNARANRLARELRAAGVGEGSRVAVYTEHSPETVVAILGALKAGACYVPLDAAHPPARVAFTLADSGAAAVLTQERLAASLPEGGAAVIRLDAERPAGGPESEENLEAEVPSGAAAYVIYTSGSTGQPKGVVVSHRSLVNYVWWAARSYLRGERLNFALHSSLAFDLTITSVFTPLVTGNAVVVFPETADESPIRAVLADERVGVVKLTPSHLSLVKGTDVSRSRVRRIIVGGEAFGADLARQIDDAFGRQADIFNEYGPTEATVGCMIHHFDRTRDTRAAVPIGRPAANARVYLLDAHLRPVADNVPGELYIAGDGLAEGYLNRDELTRERFVPDPFVPGRRMYRTGDSARRLPEGVLEFLGRRDEQVKFHGYRVELGEIRGALNQHPQVGDSVVRVYKDRSGGDVMVAFYVAERELEAAHLREFLAGSVIEETIPNLFVRLERLPLNVNGKLDARALPTLEEVRRQLKRTFDAPRTPTERTLAGIWSQLFDLAEVGVSDNFFDLGGHSLLATQLLSRVRAAFDVEIPLRSLFDAPTVAGLAEAVEAVRGREEAVEAPPITRAERDGSAPLSFAQQRLWFIDQLEPGSPLYNCPVAVRLKGRLDLGALERALTEIVRRHESLRTTFPAVNGKAAQVISEPRAVTLDVTDLGSLPEAEREPAAIRLAAEEARRPFDLAAGPLMRAGLLRLADEDHVALFTLHHIVSDGWSMGVLVNEVATLYAAFNEGRPSPLPELAVQYADFAAWQRDWLRGDALDRQLSYWKRQLADLPTLRLPTDRPRPSEQTFRGASQITALSKEVSEKLNALGREEGATLFMTLLAAWQLLLQRYSGQSDISVGTPIANRNRGETEGLIGFFVNTLVIRTDLSGDPTFRELLARVREVTLGAYAHQDTPFEQVVEALQPERSLGVSPLFQVLFVLQNAPQGTLELPGLTLRSFGGENTTAKFDLTLNVSEANGQVFAAVEYNTDLFDRPTIARMIGHFETLLAAVVDDPGARVSTLPILTEGERRRLLEEWSASGPAVAGGRCLHRIFEEHAARTPAALALAAGETRLTYGELNARANQVARHLRTLGVGVESKVGIYMERSAEVILALLAVLKAGGAYVPLDPEYPQERTALALAEAAPAAILTKKEVGKYLPPNSIPTFRLDAEWDAVALLSGEDLEGGAGPENLAYVIFTSGSTGRPNSVGVSHGAAANLLVQACDIFLVRPESRVLNCASLSFDVSVLEIFLAFVGGASLHVAGVGGRPSASEIGELVRAEGLTTGALLPSLMRTLEGQEMPTLRAVSVGGEPCPPDMPARWSYMDRFLNCYGPTEASMFATFEACSGEYAKQPPIGRPVGGMSVYVLDRAGRLVPVGVEGEIHLGGVGLARGYLGRPDLTAERFVPHPFSAEPGARLYRTGDLGKFDAEGRLEYVGRLDEQVKVRGYRVELGEVETVLCHHWGVKEAVVVAREDEPGRGARLVAYVVASPGEELTPYELRGYLKRKLPEYMIPSAFVMLDALPLTVNAKVDKRALPAPGQLRPEGEGQFVAPRTPQEELLAGIWSQTLGVERVGVDDNFFELGGDSILSIQITARAAQAGLHFTPKQLFQHQTVAELVEVAQVGPLVPQLDADPAAEATRFPLAKLSAPKLEKLVNGDETIEDIYPLSPMQHGMLFHSLYAPEVGAYFSQVVSKLPPDADVEALKRAWEYVMNRHEVLRTAFVWEGLDEPLQIVRRDVPLPWEELDWRGADPADCPRLLDEFLSSERRQRSDPSRAPLMRLTLVRRPHPQPDLFVWSCHHLLVDGWSMPLLVREVFAAYEAYRKGGEPEGEAVRPFRDYIGWLGRQDARAAEGYWRDRLKGFTRPTPLGGRTAQAGEPAYEERRLSLSAELTSAIGALARREQLTMNTLVQGAWGLVLSRASGERDIVYGVTVSGRPAGLEGVEQMMGLFINTLPVRLRVEDDTVLLRWLKRLQREQAEMRQYEYSPLVQVQGWSEVPRGLPLFESNEVFLNLREDAAAVEKYESVVQNVRSTNPTNFPLTLKCAPGERLSLRLLYDSRRFEEADILRRLGQLETLLGAMVARPESTLGVLAEALAEAERARQNQTLSKRKESGLSKFKSLKPKAMSFSRSGLVKTGHLAPGGALPLVIRPEVEGVDLIEWSRDNKAYVEAELLKHRGILFRDFAVDSVEKFDRFVRVFSPDLMGYLDQHTPRTRVSGDIYTSTEYPAEHHVPFHSENSKNHQWPLKIWFYCVQPAREGGETPIADNRRVYELLDPALSRRFAEKKVMYVRNFGEGLGLSWQTVFQTDDRASVEAYCRAIGASFEWRGADRLRMSHVCQAVARHPQTGEMLWFNQAHLFHVSSLEANARAALLSLFRSEELPSNAYYGDGSPIEDSVIEEIRDAFERAAVRFAWRERDVLMLDNMTVAHGRAPYSGSRRVLAAMAEPFVNHELVV